MVFAAGRGQTDNSGPSDGYEAESVADTNGNLHVPSDYRSAYRFLGCWAASASGGPGAKEMHIVYASSGTIAAYRKSGRFPDGAVLVKEVTNRPAFELEGW